MRKESDSSKNENVCAIIYESNLLPAQHHSCWFYFGILEMRLSVQSDVLMRPGLN